MLTSICGGIGKPITNAVNPYSAPAKSMSATAQAATVAAAERLAPATRSWVGIVARVADNEEVDANELLNVAEAAGKSVAADLDNEVVAYRRYRQLVADMNEDAITTAMAAAEAAGKLLDEAFERVAAAKIALEEAELARQQVGAVASAKSSQASMLKQKAVQARAEISRNELLSMFARFAE